MYSRFCFLLSLSLSIPTPLLSLSLPFSPAWLMAGIVARLTRRVTILYPNATQRSLRRHTQTKSSPFLNLSSRLWSLTLGPHSSAEMMQEIANVVFFSSTERKWRWLCIVTVTSLSFLATKSLWCEKNKVPPTASSLFQHLDLVSDTPSLLPFVSPVFSFWLLSSVVVVPSTGKQKEIRSCCCCIPTIGSSTVSSFAHLFTTLSEDSWSEKKRRNTIFERRGTGISVSFLHKMYLM